jgi:WXXGXW repeat (2 copies)
MRRFVLAACLWLGACYPTRYGAYGTYGGPYAGGYVAVAPPAPLEVSYASRSGYVWVQGHWAWINGQYQWVGGYYEPERVGSVWVDGYWGMNGGRWGWSDGYWTAQRPGYAYSRGYWDNRGGSYVWVQGRWNGGGGGYGRPQTVDHRGDSGGGYSPQPYRAPAPSGGYRAPSGGSRDHRH